MKYEVEKIGRIFKVKDTTSGKYITKDVPTKETAQEIADDFNAMEKKDFRPIGMPDFSKRTN